MNGSEAIIAIIWLWVVVILIAVAGIQRGDGMDDLISRKESYNLIIGQPPEPHYPSWYAEQIKELPPAVPKTGKWIDHRDEGYVECPFCRSATNCDGNIDELHYCFSCGAKMDG